MLHSMINQRLGRYTIHELLGRGGMAAVYGARDGSLQRDVALKILYPQYSDDESLAKRFNREAITAASLEHPNIVPIYDVGEQDGMAFIAMKLLHGRPLVDLLNERGSLPIEELLPILEQIGAALDYAHGKGVIHRDIKPGNIILELPRSHTPLTPPATSAAAASDATGVGAPPALQQAAPGPLPPNTVAILTDFGIAKSLDAPGMTTTGAMLGTPDYMAPEQIAGERVDRRTDVYALGVLVYRALSGKRPFGGSTQDVLMGHLRMMPEDPSYINNEVPDAFDPLIMRALAKKPADRFGSAGEFVRALRATAEGKRIHVPAPTPVSVPAQPTKVNTPLPATHVPNQILARPIAPTRPITQPPVRRTNHTGWLLAAIALALLLALGMIGFGISKLLAGIAALPTQSLATATVPAVAIGLPSASVTMTSTASPTVQPTGATAATPSASPEQPTASQAPATPVVQTVLVTVPPPATVRIAATRPPVPPLPTNTVAPPTDTPVPPTDTPVPPTNTPMPPTEVACNIDLLRNTSGFRVLYENDIGVRGLIGCPTSNEQSVEIADQIFERGTMYWWRTRDTVYAMTESQGRGGKYEAFNKAQAAALPDPPDPGDPLINRQGGFARVYYGVPAIHDAIGRPIAPERGINGAFQQFDNGFMIWSPANGSVRVSTIYVVYQDGTFRRYDDVHS